MPQLLTVLATSCPNLRRLSVKLPTVFPYCYKEFDHCGLIDDGGDWDTWAGCLPLLRQLEVLILDGMKFKPWSSIYDQHQRHDHLWEHLANGGPGYAVGNFFKGLNLKVSSLCSFIFLLVSFLPLPNSYLQVCGD